MKADRFRFRAWDGEGMLAHKNGDFFVQFDGSLWENCCSFEDALVEKHDLIIMQSTGLLDVNGKEIFEGDVVRKHWGWIGGEDIFRNHDIRFYREENEMAWHLGDCHNLWDNGDVEIIGNIYENPELLDTAE